jgi:hypothetical protein
MQTFYLTSHIIQKIPSSVGTHYRLFLQGNLPKDLPTQKSAFKDYPYPTEFIECVKVGNESEEDFLKPTKKKIIHDGKIFYAETINKMVFVVDAISVAKGFKDKCLVMIKSDDPIANHLPTFHDETGVWIYCYCKFDYNGVKVIKLEKPLLLTVMTDGNIYVNL